MTPRRSLVWLGAGALVVLLARTIGYAAMPSPLAGLYAHRAGGPALPEIALVALSLAAAVAVAVCWLAALGVRERQLLERRVLVTQLPPLRPGASSCARSPSGSSPRPCPGCSRRTSTGARGSAGTASTASSGRCIAI